MADVDEYDFYDFSEFTHEDFAHIDKALLSEFATQDTQKLNGGPALEIKLELSNGGFIPTQETPQQQPPKAELSDLVSPAWCEVQFDYGLRQNRSRKLEHRPDSFVSAEGKTIVVQKDVAEKNYEATTNGQTVHKALEREIHGEEVSVTVETDEERWALRLVNTISSLSCLVSIGYAREIPVFGIIQNQIVVGIIDELQRRPVLRPSSNLDNSSMPADQTSITTFLHGSDSPLLDSPNSTNSVRQSTKTRHSHTLHLLDTKTRRTNTLPADEDTISSRLQLMLYHQLLSDLISDSPPFDFDVLWTCLGLDPSRLFSDSFLAQMMSILEENYSTLPSCLDTLTDIWTEAVKQLDVPGVERTLQLVYRTQPTPSRGIKRKKLPESPIIVEATEQEESDLAFAIQASLDDMITANKRRFLGPVYDEQPHKGIEPGQPHKDAVNSEVSTKGSALHIASEAVDMQTNVKSPDSLDSSSDGRLDEASDHSSSRIIGIKEFTLDENFLNDYISSVLDWWYGHRKPRGVNLEHTRRCFTCEYSTGCEWREARAKEFEDQLCKDKEKQAANGPEKIFEI